MSQVLPDGFVFGKRFRLPWEEDNMFSHTNPTPDTAPDHGHTPRIAVVLHLFYPELWPEFRDALQRLPGNLLLAVTGPATSLEPVAKEIVALFPEARLCEYPNRGRDIAPFMHVLPSVLAQSPDLILKLHGKKSTHRSDGDLWRQDLLNGLIPAENAMATVFQSFAKDPELGLLVPNGHLLHSEILIEENTERVDALIARLGMSSPTTGWYFAAGSMFWFRPAALAPLLKMGLALDDFEEETGQLDGTLAHAMERIFSLAAIRAGMKTAEMPLIGERSNIHKEYADPAIYQLRRILEERDHQIFAFHQKLAENEIQVAYLHQELAERELRLANILSSRSWRITRPLRAMRRITGWVVAKRHLVKNVYLLTCSQIKRHGLTGFIRRIPYYLANLRKCLSLATSQTLTVDGTLFSAAPPTPQQIRLHPDLDPSPKAQINESISFVIPTLNAGPEFAWLMRKLRSQLGVGTIEIVIVDSGSTDETVKIARASGCTVVEITPEEFSHSYARNTGADAASGNYLLFMVQDAFPIGLYWAYGILNYLLEYKASGLAAVSCAEYSRSDSDMMYDSMIHTHYRFLGCLDYDRIGEYQGDDHMSLRAYGQLSDVSCLIPRETFQKYRYRGNYAEDLDLGIRLIKDGRKVAMMASVKVIHSHNRPAYYYLKRSFVDVVFLVGMFDDFIYQRSKSPQGMIVGIVSVAAYLSEWLIGFNTSDTAESLHDSLQSYSDSWRNSFSKPRPGEPSHLGDDKLDQYIDSLATRYLNRSCPTDASDIRYETRRFLDAFLARLDHFNGFAKDVYGCQDTLLRTQLREVIIKTFCATAGSSLGFMYMESEGFEENDRSMIDTIYKELKAGI
jgi:glycosyltransferase involved in cell wall biosynthesis